MIGKKTETVWGRDMFVALLLLLAAAATACPFYQAVETPGGDPTTNYTLLSTAMAAAMSTPAFAVPIVACDGATVGANETLPSITQGITIVGASGGTGATPFAHLTINGISPLGAVFDVQTANGVGVTFENIAIVAGDQTLFRVSGSATLTLRNVKCELTTTCVQVDATGSSTTVPPGLDADTVAFIGTLHAIVHTAGTVTCRHCTFVDTFEAGIVTRLAVYNPYALFTLYDVHFVNTLYPMAYQSAPGTPLSPPEVSGAYVDRTMFYNTQTYSVAATTVELFGTSGCPVCETCDCPPCYSKWVNISLVILLALGIFVCVLTCVFRASTGNKPVTAQDINRAKAAAY